MSTENTRDIRIGSCVEATKDPLPQIQELLKHGFESFAITFWGGIGEIDLAAFRDEVLQAMDGHDAVISALTLFGNPLEDTEEAEVARADWNRLIEAAPGFGCRLITGFTGAVSGQSIPENMPRLKEVFSPLAETAGERGLRLAFENCVMGGTWKSAGRNLAFAPEAFELIFETLPYENVGLEWEPAHLIKQMVDPIQNLVEWAPRIFHYHGKDGTMRWEVLRRAGNLGKESAFWQRYPGYGDTDWCRIISEARKAGFGGAIDIEGYHDPIFTGPLEMAGMLGSFDYLKRCRGRFV